MTTLVSMLLSGLVGIIMVLASHVRERVRSYYALLLLAQASITGAMSG